MSYYDYKRSLELILDDPPFGALLMAAMRKADHYNLEKFGRMWPQVLRELRERYNSPGGKLEGETQ